MDARKFNELRQSVSGDKRGRFDAVINSLRNSGELSGMSDRAIEGIVTNIAKRYGATAQAVEPQGMLGGGEGSIPTAPTGGVLGGPGADSVMTKELADAAMGYGKKAAAKGALGLAAGAPLGAVLEGAFDPVGIASAAAGGIGKGVMETLGFDTKAQGIMEKIGLSGASMALSMVNPALGLTAQVLDKPAIQVAADALDARTAEEDRDAIEEEYGKIKGMQIQKELANRVNLEQYMPDDAERTEFGYQDALSRVNRQLEEERNKAMRDPNTDLSTLDSMIGQAQELQNALGATRGEVDVDTMQATRSMANRERAGEVANLERERSRFSGGGMLSGGEGRYGRETNTKGYGGNLGEAMSEKEEAGLGGRTGSGMYGGGGEGGFGGGRSSGGDFGDRESQRGGMGGV